MLKKLRRIGNSSYLLIPGLWMGLLGFSDDDLFVITFDRRLKKITIRKSKVV